MSIAQLEAAELASRNGPQKGIRIFEPGSYIYQMGFEAEKAYLLLKGLAQILICSAEGREVEAYEIRERAILGDEALVGAEEYTTSARALTECHVQSFRPETLSQSLTRNPQLAYKLILAQSRAKLELVDSIEDYAFRNIAQRTARTLLDLASDNFTIDGFSHQQLAIMVGTYRETLTQMVGSFSRAGLLVVIGKKFMRLLEPEKLQLIYEFPQVYRDLVPSDEPALRLTAAGPFEPRSKEKREKDITTKRYRLATDYILASNPDGARRFSSPEELVRKYNFELLESAKLRRMKSKPRLLSISRLAAETDQITWPMEYAYNHPEQYRPLTRALLRHVEQILPGVPPGGIYDVLHFENNWQIHWSKNGQRQ